MEIGLAENDVKSNGRPMPPGFDRFESFGHNDLTAKHYYFRCSRPTDLDGIKIFDKDNQATKYCFYRNVLRPGHFYQTFRSHQHQEVLST